MDGLLEVGQIVNSYGIKGFLKVVPLVDNNNQFKDFKRLYIHTKQELTVEEVKFSKNLVLIKVEGIDTIEDALKLKNLYLTKLYFYLLLFHCIIYLLKGGKDG